MLALPTGRRGQAFALALTLVVPAGLWMGIAHPLLRWYDDRAEMLRERTIFADRLAAAAQSVPTLRQQAQAAAQDARANDGILSGGTDALAGAELQGLLERLARDANATLSSTETLPAEPVGGFRRISVRLSVRGSWSSLVALLASIDRATVSLLTDNVQIHATSGRGRADLPPIEAAFTVSGFRAAPASTVDATPGQAGVR